MKPTVFSIIAAVGIASLAIVQAQTTRPSSSERVAQIAKDFGVTPEALEKFVRKELGDLVVAEEELAVGVHRDDAGRIATVKIATPKRIVEFNVRPEEGKPGMEYTGGEVAPGIPFASATDIDGDLRIDQIIIRHTIHEGPNATLLIRIGDRFEPATPARNQRFQLAADGRVMKFDRTSHEWVEEKP